MVVSETKPEVYKDHPNSNWETSGNNNNQTVKFCSTFLLTGNHSCILKVRKECLIRSVIGGARNRRSKHPVVGGIDQILIKSLVFSTFILYENVSYPSHPQL